MLTCDGQNASQQFFGIQSTGGVVRVDDDDALGAGCHLGADIVQIRHPAVGFVAQVMHRGATRQAGGGRPQRIVRGRQQQLIAVVQQGVGGHHDQFAGPIAQINVIQRDTLDALLLGFMHHGFARGKNPLAVRIARRVGQVTDHVLLDFLGGIKTKDRQIANIELDDLVTVFLHLLGRVHDGTPDVVTNIGKLGGFVNGFHGGRE